MTKLWLESHNDELQLEISNGAEYGKKEFQQSCKVCKI
ncbi:hypothetical protein BD31_I2009 [Candidatus Nitrosopumilus salaria BD31]|uniref:Uncharacterized protein n=1 Tax=Candidatus Nitrosopumilus salarius BD31 TaxID=859350 RepID=I3D1T0_9ARCH|nr:hypothetical protein BD31_I2009 [Candidatus Nitrosopumilus salaria BD31]